MTMLIALGAAALMLAGKALVMKKMGLEGWKALIPVYGDYVLFENVQEGKTYILTIVFSALSMIFAFHGNTAMSVIISLLGLYGTFLCCRHVADFFRKDMGVAVGLALLPVVFYPILGFGETGENRYAARQNG